MAANFLDPVFRPLLSLEPFFVILILSFVLTLIATLIYKFMTDQKMMKSLKEDLKKHQEELKKHRNNPTKMMEVQKAAMEKNMKYMMLSMKPTLVTFIPIILIFSWMNSALAFYPIAPTETFTTTLTLANSVAGNVSLELQDGLVLMSPNQQEITNHAASWEIKAVKEGSYFITYLVKDKTYTKEVLVTTEQRYEQAVKVLKNDPYVKQMTVSYRPLRVFGDNFSIFGWHPGWIGTYIILSIIFSLGLRKLMGLH